MAPTKQQTDQLDLLGLAEQCAANPAPFVDDRVDADGTFVGDVTPPTHVRERATNIHYATLNAGVAEAVDSAAAPRSEADGLAAEIRELVDVHATARRRLAEAESGIDAIQSVPNHVRPTAAKAISLAAKPTLITGDTMLLGQTFYTQGSPLWMAALSGLAITVSAVTTGSLVGRKFEQENQRRDRGPVPDGTRPEHFDLFARSDSDGGSGGSGRWFWLGVAVLVAFVLATAVTMFAAGTGASTIEALGLGLLAGCTVIGSAAAEAYGTNAAEDRLKAYQKEAAVASEQLEEAAGMIRERDTADSIATSRHQAGIARAHSSAIAAGTIANTEVNDPRIYGYLSPRTAEELTWTMPKAPDHDLADRSVQARATSDRFGDDALHQFVNAQANHSSGGRTSGGHAGPNPPSSDTAAPGSETSDEDVIDLNIHAPASHNPPSVAPQHEEAS